MAHLPPDPLSNLPPFSQARTLFLPAEPGTVGVLVVQRGRRTTATSRRFSGGATAALAWCVKERVNLVCFFAASPTQN